MSQSTLPQAPGSAGLNMAMVAGEASGDLLASLLLAGARRNWPALYSSGIGGSHMQQEGFEAHWSSERLAVHGYSLEVLKRIAGLVHLRRQLAAQLLAQRPDVFVGVDAPDFNLGLEVRLRKAGIPTVHFVCPSIWAWRAERVHTLRAAADHVLCIFPFEPELLARHGISASFVGHPLASVIALEPDQPAARARLGLADDARVLALLPGSRSKEIDYLLPRFLQTCELLLQRDPHLQLVLPGVPAQLPRIAALLQRHGMAGRVRLLKGRSHCALEACDVTLIASGTATLEAALFKKPMVISYAMHPLSAALMRRKQLQPWVGLPNILLGRMAVPELIQEQATPEALAAELAGWLEASAARDARWQDLRRQFHGIHTSLQADTAALASHAIKTLLGC